MKHKSSDFFNEIVYKIFLYKPVMRSSVSSLDLNAQWGLIFRPRFCEKYWWDFICWFIEKHFCWKSKAPMLEILFMAEKWLCSFGGDPIQAVGIPKASSPLRSNPASQLFPEYPVMIFLRANVPLCASIFHQCFCYGNNRLCCHFLRI